MGGSEGSHATRVREWLVAACAGERLWVALTSAVLLLVAMPLLALARFNQPSADDFCLVNRVVGEGFVAFNRSIYLGWTGRFVTTALYGAFYAGSAASARAWSLSYPLLAVTTFTALLVALWICARAWLGRTWQTGARAWGVTAAVATLSVLGMPSLYEGLFWAASSLQYALSVVWLLGLVAAAAALAPSALPVRGRALAGAAALLFSVAAIGSNETIAAPVFAFIALMLRASWQERACRAWWLAILAAALVATFVLLVAPGNYLRLGHVETLSVPGALARAVAVLATQLASWLTPTLAMTALVLLLLSLDAEAPLVRGWPHPFVVALGMLAVLAGMLLPSVWAYHGGVPPRVLSTLYLVFAAFAGIWMLSLASYLRARYPLALARLRAGAANVDLRIVVCALCLLTLAGAPNFRAMWRDLALGHAQSFRDASAQRHATAMRAPRGAALAFAPIAELPRTIVQEDLSADAAYWKNVCFAARYGLLSVHTEAPAPRGER